MEKKATNKNNIRVFFVLAGILLIILAIVVLLYLLMKGETKTSGEWLGTESTESIVCNIVDKTYPFYTYDNSKSKETKVNIIFDNNKIQSISLTNILYYDDEKVAVDSENLNHIAMNDSFGINGLKFDDLNLKFAKFDGGLQMNIYSENIDGVSAKYFLLDREYLNSNESTIRKFFEGNNFKCENNK